MVLAFAGVMKLATVAVQGRFGVWPPEVMVAISAVELLLAVWLIANAGRSVASLAGLLVFLVFAVSAAIFSFSAAGTCPCLGLLNSPPVVLLGLDLTFVAAFGMQILSVPREMRRALALELFGEVRSRPRVLLLAAVLTVVPAATTLRRMTAPAGLVQVEGQPITIGKCRPASEKTIRVIVANHSDHDARIFGGGTSCGCLTLSKLPVNVRARSSAELQLLLKAPKQAGPLRTVFVYYIEHPEQYEVLGLVEGTVVAGVADTGGSGRSAGISNADAGNPVSAGF